MSKRILLLTGNPNVGKTTVIINVVDALKNAGFNVGGMVSREVRKDNVRVGFEIVDLHSGMRGWLAQINQKKGPKVGKYHVNIQDLENIGANAITYATKKCDCIAIDEVGPMELFSLKFKLTVEQALNSKKLVLAVIHGKAKDPLIMEAKKRDDAETFIVTVDNRDKLPEELTKKALEIFKSSRIPNRDKTI